MGTAAGMERAIVTREGLPFAAISAGGLRGFAPWRILSNGLKLLKGVFQAWRIIRSFRPDAVLATGGYVSAPTVFAAWLSRVPVLIYLPDVEPGLAVKALSRFAERVAVSIEPSLTYFPPGKAVVTGYPVRPELYARERRVARERLGLSDGDRVILVFGGSRGAGSINRAVGACLERLLGECTLIHIAGRQDIEWLRERREGLSAELRERYRVYEYLYEEMVDALAAADLAVARAGAATMGEFAAVGLPSVLVPYPHAGRHQDANADALVAAGAAVKVRDEDLPSGALETEMLRLIRDEERLRRMSENARKLAQPNAARNIGYHLLALAGENACGGVVWSS